MHKLENGLEMSAGDMARCIVDETALASQGDNKISLSDLARLMATNIIPKECLFLQKSKQTRSHVHPDFACSCQAQ